MIDKILLINETKCTYMFGGDTFMPPASTSGKRAGRIGQCQFDDPFQ